MRFKRSWLEDSRKSFLPLTGVPRNKQTNKKSCSRKEQSLFFYWSLKYMNAMPGTVIVMGSSQRMAKWKGGNTYVIDDEVKPLNEPP